MHGEPDEQREVGGLEGRGRHLGCETIALSKAHHQGDAGEDSARGDPTEASGLSYSTLLSFDLPHVGEPCTDLLIISGLVLDFFELLFISQLFFLLFTFIITGIFFRRCFFILFVFFIVSLWQVKRIVILRRQASSYSESTSRDHKSIEGTPLSLDDGLSEPSLICSIESRHQEVVK